MSTENASSPGENRSSPIPGCVILVAILIVFGGLVVLYTVVGLYQNRTINEFTQDAAAEIPVATPSAEEVSAVQEKLEGVRKAVEEEKVERFVFSAADLNALIATEPDLEDFRGQTYIERISPQGIVARMAQPMRKGIFDKGVRYLNATFVLQPELRARTLAFKVVDIRPVVGKAPEGFVKNYATLDFFRLDPELEAIKNHIRAIAAVYAEGGQIVVETKIPDLQPVE